MATYGATRLVIVADPDYHAAGIYESVGFRPVERVCGVSRPRPNEVGSPAMLDGHKHLEKKLRKHGARGMADITVAHETQVDRGSLDAAGEYTGGEAYRWHYRFGVR